MKIGPSLIYFVLKIIGRITRRKLKFREKFGNKNNGEIFRKESAEKIKKSLKFGQKIPRIPRKIAGIF